MGLVSSDFEKERDMDQPGQGPWYSDSESKNSLGRPFWTSPFITAPWTLQNCKINHWGAHQTTLARIRYESGCYVRKEVQNGHDQVQCLGGFTNHTSGMVRGTCSCSPKVQRSLYKHLSGDSGVE